MKKRVAVLGATGSIGKSSLDVLSRGRENFDVVLLAARSDSKGLEKAAAGWPEARCVLAAGDSGRKELLDAIEDAHADIVINGISGSAGLEPSIKALNGGTLALANKETVVMAGPLVLKLAREKETKIIPVDSEHSAIFHLIQAHGVPEEIFLTASGGPFLNSSTEEMEKATVEAAVAHPTWKMGPKISVDSASMANKGLEVIEAAFFFNMPPEKIRVVIHPQSVVHAMIRLCNGSFYAHISKPDMRGPIHDALYWPEIRGADFGVPDFDSLCLEFKKPDFRKFPMLGLAYDAAKQGRLYPCVYNGANEAAVAAFFQKRIGFLDIPVVTRHVLEMDWPGDCDCVQSVLNADKAAREAAENIIKGNF